MRTPRSNQGGLNRGAWTPEEDGILKSYIKANGARRWSDVPMEAGLKRCGKSCRLRWVNYLRPDVKRGNMTHEEEDLIIRLHKLLGNRWSLIAGRLPGRTDNEIKNYWNTTLKKRVLQQGSITQPHLAEAGASDIAGEAKPVIEPVERVVTDPCGEGEIQGNVAATTEDCATSDSLPSCDNPLLLNEDDLEDWLGRGRNQACCSWEFCNLDFLWGGV